MSCEKLLGVIKKYPREEIIVPRNVPIENFVSVWETRKISDTRSCFYKQAWKIGTIVGTICILLIISTVMTIITSKESIEESYTNSKVYTSDSKGLHDLMTLQ